MEKYIGIKEFAKKVYSCSDTVRALVCRPEFAPYRKDGMYTRILDCNESIELMKSLLNKGYIPNYATNAIIKERPKKKRYSSGYYPKVTGWTKSAVDCYNIGCTCSRCSVYNLMEGECQMKLIVFECVRKFGRPQGDFK